MLRCLLLLLLCAPLGGCYYMQAAAGQWEVVRKREPLQEVINDPETAPELAERLALLSEARDFSITVLGLPDNNSYRTYADLERDYVVWNVFAAPEFSLTPRTWCFPVAGCVAYRGYFGRDAAEREAERLRNEGYDVAVSGVAAYSTLGKFSDPILSTMMHWDDTALVALLFHELAHQVIYVQDDSAFNESFATAVEEFGVEEWLAANGAEASFRAYEEKRAYRQRVTNTIIAARDELVELYASEKNEDDMRREKSRILEALVAAVAEEAESSGRRPPAWGREGLNNANLISTSLYAGYLPAFRQLRAACSDMDCFYREVAQLAELPAAERKTALDTLERNAPDA